MTSVPVPLYPTTLLQFVWLSGDKTFLDNQETGSGLASTYRLYGKTYKRFL